MPEKKHRHQHHKKHPHEIDNGVDLTDMASLSDAANAASASQRGGDDYDETGGIAATDLSADIVAVLDSGGQSRIIINRGTDDGVQLGQDGYIKGGDGMLASFTIDNLTQTTAQAYVDINHTFLERNLGGVVVGPSSLPKSARTTENMQADVVNFEEAGDSTVLVMNRGASHGAVMGQKGNLLDVNGTVVASFTLTEVHPGVSKAYVDLSYTAAIQYRSVIINPGDGAHHGGGHHHHHHHHKKGE